MENNFIGQKELGQFVDRLAAQKTPGQPLTDEVRTKIIQDLDERVDNAVLGSLNSAQLKELDAILTNNGSETDVQNFFVNAGIDIEQEITTVLKDFSAEFLGGENA